MRLASASLAVMACLAGVAASTAAAAPGELDTSFGAGGVVDLRSKLAGTPIDLVGVERGKAVVLSRVVKCLSPGVAPCVSDLVLTRFRAHGARDSTFGQGAAEVTALAELDAGGSLAVDSEGRLVVAGIDEGRFEVVRLGRNGGLDRSFGVNGLATVGGATEVSDATVAIGEGDEIVVAGRRVEFNRAHSAYPFDTTLVTARFLADGSLDTHFHPSGFAPTTIPEAVVDGVFALQSGGAVLAAWSQCCTSASGLRVARVWRNGALDPAFGPPPRRGFSPALPPVTNAIFQIAELVPRSRGRIDVVGWLEGEGFLLRLGRDGDPIRSFGEAGIRLFKLPFEAAAADRYGRLLAVGEASRRLGFVVTRIRANGRLDRTFGTNGHSDPVANGDPSMGDLLIAAEPDGSPVVIDQGFPSCRGECPAKPVLVRYRGGRPPRCHPRHPHCHHVVRDRSASLAARCGSPSR